MGINQSALTQPFSLTQWHMLETLKKNHGYGDRLYTYMKDKYEEGFWLWDCDSVGQE